LQSQIAKKYVLKDQVIYRGLASTIYLGVERVTALQVALKVLMKHKFENEGERKQALREVELHFVIPPHSNVIQLMDAEETPSAILLVTPYAPCGDLWELVRYGKTYCEVEVRNLAAQMLQGLQHIHDTCDLIHGDIKPHNFLMFRVDGKNAVKICDFGLAEHPDTVGGTLTFRGLRGTSGWFAPEVLAHHDYGFAVDLFGMGLILFRMLGGYPPFDPPSCFSPALEFDERYWGHVSMACRQMLAQLLSLEPSERGSAKSCMEHDWFCGPPPPEASPLTLKEMSKYGPPPDSSVLFWPPSQIPSEERHKSFADLSSLGGDDGENDAMQVDMDVS